MPWSIAAAVIPAAVGAAGQAGLFGGSGPSVSQSPQATITTTQENLQSWLGPFLQSLIQGTNTQGPTPGTVSPAQATGQAAIPGAVGTATGETNTTLQALNSVLSGQPIDISQYFKNAIAAPLEQNFSQQTLPAIKAAFARSAGGTYSGFGGDANPTTGFTGAVNFADQNLQNTLSQQASTVGYQSLQDAITNQLKAATIAPGAATTPLTSLINALSAQNQPFSNLMSLLGISSPFSTGTGTVQPNQIVSPGNAGFANTFLGNQSNTSGIINALQGLFGNSTSGSSAAPSASEIAQMYAGSGGQLGGIT